MAESVNHKCPDLHFTKGSCRITLKLGDLLKETGVDAIVIPTPERGESEDGKYSVFKAILDSADEGLKTQIKESGSKIELGGQPQPIKDAKPCIILAPIPYDGSKKKALSVLAKTYTDCLDIADQNECLSIAFPTIGFVKSGFSSDAVARKLHGILDNQIGTKINKLNDIRLIMYSEEIYQGVTNLFMERSGDPQYSIKFQPVPPPQENPSEPRPPSPREDPVIPPKPDALDSTQSIAPCITRSPCNPEVIEFKPTIARPNFTENRFWVNNNSTEIIILQADITKIKVDAIVNAANESMSGGAGVDGVIHRAAGPNLLDACYAHKDLRNGVRLPTGRSRILLSYCMSPTTTYIINTAGPRYDRSRADQCRELLASCYRTSLALANLYDLETIAYPAISCGIFGYPADDGAEVALRTAAQEAGKMRQIFFTLREDHIYQAWMTAARKLYLDAIPLVQMSNPQIPPPTQNHQSNGNKVPTETVVQPTPQPSQGPGQDSTVVSVVQATTDKQSNQAEKSPSKSTTEKNPTGCGRGKRTNKQK